MLERSTTTQKGNYHAMAEASTPSDQEPPRGGEWESATDSQSKHDHPATKVYPQNTQSHTRIRALTAEPSDPSISAVCTRFARAQLHISSGTIPKQHALLLIFGC